MPKFSKIRIIIILMLIITGGFAIFHFSFAQGTLSFFEGQVYVCPKTTSLEEVYYGCPGMIIFLMLN